MAKKNTAPEFITVKGPDWAASYLEYGDPGDLTPEECEEITRAVESFEERTGTSYVTVGDCDGDDFGVDDLLEKYCNRVCYIFERTHSEKAA